MQYLLSVIGKQYDFTIHAQAVFTAHWERQMAHGTRKYEKSL